MDVVVEHAVLVAVFVEKAEGVGIGKVLKLDEAIYSKPVGRERKGHVIASSSWSLADWGGGSGEVQARGEGTAHSRSVCHVAGSWTSGSAHPTMEEDGEGRGQGYGSWRPAKPISLSLTWAAEPRWWLSGKESTC